MNMNIDDFFESKPCFLGELKICARCSECGSQIQSVFKFESSMSGHVGARCCHRCGDVKQRLSSRDLVQMVSIETGNDFPTVRSPYE